MPPSRNLEWNGGRQPLGQKLVPTNPEPGQPHHVTHHRLLWVGQRGVLAPRTLDAGSLPPSSLPTLQPEGEGPPA